MDSLQIIIPAHNEERVIGQSLRALFVAGAQPDDVIVVCNGCKDSTADAARSVGVRVIESPVPSKVCAINLGLSQARPGSVAIVDADIRLGGEGVAGLMRALERPGVLAAAPVARMEYAPGTTWMVRAYYRVWFSLPYVSEGMVGCGVYALNAAGRERLGELPDVIADDGFVRGSFAPHERARADEVIAMVRAPRTLRDLVKIKTRSRLGYFQLSQRFRTSLPGRNEKSQHKSAWLGMLARPDLWLSIAPYLYVNVVSRRRARQQLQSLATYVWERDESAREGTSSQ